MDMWGKLSAGFQTVQDRLDSYIEEGAAAITQPTTDDSQSTGKQEMTGRDDLEVALKEAEERNRLINKEFQRLLREKEGEIRSLRGQLDTRSQVSSSESSASQQLKDQLQQKEKDLQDLEAKADGKLARLKQQAKTKITSLQQQVETLQQELAKHAQGESGDTNDDVDGKGAEIPDADSLSQLGGGQDKELLDKLEAVQQDHMRAEQRWLEERQHLEQQLLNLQEESVSTSDQLCALQTQQEKAVRQWEEDRANLVADLEEQRRLVESAKAKHDAEDHPAVEGIVEELQKHVKQLTSELDESKSKLGELLTQQSVVESERDAAREEAECSKQILAESNSQAEELKVLVEQLEEEKKQLVDSLKEKEERLASENKQVMDLLQEEQAQRQASESQSELRVNEMQKQLEDSVVALSNEKESLRLSKEQLASVEEKLHIFEEEHKSTLLDMTKQLAEDKERHQAEVAVANEALASSQRQIEQLKRKLANVDSAVLEPGTQADVSTTKIEGEVSVEADGWEESAVDLVPESEDNSHVNELEHKLATVEQQLRETSTQLSESQQAQQDMKNTLEKKAKLLKAKTLKIQQLETKLKEGGSTGQEAMPSELKEDDRSKFEEVLELRDRELESARAQLKQAQDAADVALRKKDEEVRALCAEVECLKAAAISQAQCEEELERTVTALQAQLTSAPATQPLTPKASVDSMETMSPQSSPVKGLPHSLPTDVTELQQLIVEKDKAQQESAVKSEARLERLKEQAKKRLAIQQEKHEKEMEKLASEWEKRVVQLQAEVEGSKAMVGSEDSAAPSITEDGDEAESWKQSLTVRLQHLDEIQSSAQSERTESQASVDGNELAQTGVSSVMVAPNDDVLSQQQAWKRFGEILGAALEQLKAGKEVDLTSNEAEFAIAGHSLSVVEQLFLFARQTLNEKEQTASKYSKAEELLQDRQRELEQTRDELSAALQARADTEQLAASEGKRCQEYESAHRRTKQELQRVEELLAQQQSGAEEERRYAQQQVAEVTSSLEEKNRQEVEEVSCLLSSKAEECANLAQQLAAEQAVNRTEVATLNSELDEQVQRNHELNTEVTLHKERYSQLAGEFAVLKTAEAGARVEAERLQQSIGSLQADLEARVAELSSVKSSEEGLRIALAEAKLSVERVEEEQKQQAAAGQSKEEEVASWRQKANAIQKELSEQSSQVAELQLQWSESRGQCRRLQQRLDEAERQCTVAVSEAAKLRQSSSDTQNQLDSVLASLHAAQSSAAQQQARADADLSQLRRELQVLNEQVRREESRRALMEKEATSSASEKARLQEKVGVLEGKLALFTHQQGCSSQEFQDLQQQLADAQAHRDQLQVELNSALSGVRDRETQSLELSSEVARIMADQESIEQRLRQAVRQRDVAQQQEDQLKFQLAQVQGTAVLVPKMQQQLEQAATSRRELERRLADSERLCRQLETSNKELNQQFESEQQRWQQEAAVWKDELQKVQQTQEELETASSSRNQPMAESTEFVKQTEVLAEAPSFAIDSSAGMADMAEVGHIRSLLAEEQRLRHEAESSLAEARLLLSQQKQFETSDVSVNLGEPTDEASTSIRTILDAYPQLAIVAQVVSALTQRLRSQSLGMTRHLVRAQPRVRVGVLLYLLFIHTILIICFLR